MPLFALLTDFVAHSLLPEANKREESHVLPEQPQAGRGRHHSGHRLPAVQRPAGPRSWRGRHPWYRYTGGQTGECLDFGASATFMYFYELEFTMNTA